MCRIVSKKRTVIEETQSENVQCGQSGEYSSGSLPSTDAEEKVTPYTEKQKKIIEKYYPKALASAHKIKEKIRQYRELTLDEEITIDDIVVDYLQILTRKLKSDLVGAFFETSFNNLINWGSEKLRRRKKQSALSLYNEDNELQFDIEDIHPFESIDFILEDLDIPYKSKVKRLLQGEDIKEVFPSHGLRKRWLRHQKPKIQEHLRKYYQEAE